MKLSTFCLIFFCLACICDAARVFDVYRLVQYDKGSSQFGSRRVAIDHLAATPNVKSDKLSKFIIVIQLQELLQTEDLIEKLVTKHVSGVLIVIPEDSAPVDLKAWAPIEAKLTQTLLDIPVWLTYSNAEVKDLIEELESEQRYGESQASQLIADSYKLSVFHNEGQPIKAVESVNLYGFLHGNKPEKASTIAIVTHYDSFNVVPELARGVSSSAASTGALLELSRLFSKLNQKTTKTQPHYNLLFLLTGAGNFNFTGTTNFLGSTDTRILDAIEFVLCLDAIGSNNELTLHVSRSPAKDETAKRIYDMLSAVAAQMKIPFNIVQKKVNTTSEQLPWQHEHFAMKRMLAGTLSGHQTATTHLARSNLFDVKVDSALLTRNVKFIAESLARIIYKIPSNSSASVFEDSLAVSEAYVTSWTNTIGEVPRMLPFLTRDTNKKNLIAGLEKELKRHLTDVTRASFAIPHYGYTYYDATAAVMSGYRSKHVAFDILFSVALIVAFALFYASLKGVRDTLRTIQSSIYGNKKRS